MEIKKIEIIVKNGIKRLSIVSGIVIFKEGKVLLVKGKDGTHFKFPGGYTTDNENLKETAKREVIEEISCEVELSGDPVFYYLNNPADNLDIFLAHYKAIIIKGYPKPSSEIEEFKWLDINDLPGNIMENVLPIVSKLKG